MFNNKKPAIDLTKNSVNLTKGAKVNLTKPDGSVLSAINMGLGWDVARGARDIDLDASALLFDENGTLLDQVWYAQLTSREGSIRHSGDNLTGAGDGDDEVIQVDLGAVPANVKTIVFTVNSFTGDSFATVENAFVRLVERTTGEEFAKYVLSERGGHTALIMAKVYRHNGAWKIGAIGETAHGQTFRELLPAVSAHV